MSEPAVSGTAPRPRSRGHNAPPGLLPTLFEFRCDAHGCTAGATCRLCGWTVARDPCGTTVLWRHLASESHAAFYRVEDKLRDLFISVWETAVQSVKNERYALNT
jgi:hypothetical protein